VSWNYRVCKSRFDKFDPKLHSPEDEFSFSIHEVYYNDKGEITFTSVDEMSPHGTSADELKSDMTLMMRAFDKDVLDLDNIVYVALDDDD
jgi:hypothetical protein